LTTNQQMIVIVHTVFKDPVSKIAKASSSFYW